MKLTPAGLKGVFVIDPQVFGDARGFFMETYRKDVFVRAGITDEFVQDNHSRSAKGVLRGLHFQAAPEAQAKLVRVLRGSAYDVAVDIRPGSATFGKWVAETLSGENKRMMYIPEGFAHGFLALEDDTEFSYKVSRTYSPQHERGILWSDPALAIPWPRLDVPYSLSEKDRIFPTLSSLMPHGSSGRAV